MICRHGFFIILLCVTVCTAIHHSMTPLELKHFFGTRHKDKVPQYFLDVPEQKSINSEKTEINLLIDGVKETFVLRNKPHLFSEGFHWLDQGTEILDHPLMNCVFEGESVDRNGTHIALVGCGRHLNGMVITDDGDYHLIQSHKHSGQHVIHKRSLDSIEHDCQFDNSDDPYPEDREESAMRSSLMRMVKNIRRAEQRKDVLTVELAVFADDAMWDHFKKMYGSAAEENMHTFIMAVVNNIDVLYTQRLLQPRINIKIVRYEVLKAVPQMMLGRKHSNGDVDRLLDAFCQHQNEINPPSDSDPRHWDHALLFSGYDLHRNGVKTVAGYAPVKGMCSGVRSCTINEGLDFGSVFVVTHEMGHSLGMYHDGDNNCDLRCCIMSPSVGSGKTHWSQCSVNEMATFIGHLGDDFRPPNCLQDISNAENRAVAFKDAEPPGQLFTLNEQCEIFHGECWKHELKDGQNIQNVCQMTWCGNGEGVIRTAHPALEGTFCGFGMICRQGQCVRSNQLMRVTVGGWGSWNDRPLPSCGGRCSPCEIKGQIRIMRSIRQCSNPSSNNGGAPCQGDEARGLVCHKDVCNGDSTENYATRVCKKLRDESAIPNTVLSGEGMQFEQAMCKIWCLISGSSNIRTVSNFPDGTPCGYNQYCVKGECRPLLCGATTLAYSESDCPQNVKTPTTTTQSPLPSVHSVDNSASKTNPYKETKKTPFLNEWSGWSAWSECVTYDCHQQGLKVRIRRCLAGICAGQLREKVACIRPCTASERPTSTSQLQQTFRNRFIAPLPNGGIRQTNMVLRRIDQWSQWSACSVTCGTGQKLRKKENCIGQGCSEIANCVMPSCRQPQSANPNSWTSWSEWSDCSVSCGDGIKHRKRACFAPPCSGKDNEIRQCNDRACPSEESMTSNLSTGLWTGWSEWSGCSTKCGTGNRSRRRRCYQGFCSERANEQERCFGSQCR